MKKFKIFIILIIIFCVLLLCLYVPHLVDKRLLLEENQIELLKNIYLDSIKGCDYNIILDDSAIRNILTSEFFSENGIKELKQIERSSNSKQNTYKIIISYNKEYKVLTLRLKGVNINSTIKKEYYIKSNLFYIKFEGSDSFTFAK